MFVSEGYFETLEIQLVSGRDFEFRDNEWGNPMRAVVNEAFARKFFAGQNPLGRKFTSLANAPVWMEIVGMVKDAKYSSAREKALPMVYLPYGRIAERSQYRTGEVMFLQVQGPQTPSSLTVNLRGEAGQEFAIGDVTRQQQIIDDTLVREKLLASITNLFGGLVMALVVIGLYGITSYEVSMRRQEFGIRVALGAAPQAVLGMVLRQSVWIAGFGAIGGLLGGAACARLARGLLFGLSPNDPAVFLSASALLLTASLLAAFVPAYRAAKTDPMITLRHQ